MSTIYAAAVYSYDIYKSVIYVEIYPVQEVADEDN